MKCNSGSMPPGVRKSERGQALVMAPLVLTFLLAFSAFVIDIGNLYYSYQALLGDTQAAAQAGGSAMSNGAVASVSAVANQYSGWAATDYNYRTNLNITNVSVNFACVPSSSYANLNLPPCAAYSSYPSCTVTTANPAGGCNAIQVKESASVPTFFLKYFGVSSLPISATASASASGGGAIPYHIMMVLDSTSSMGSTNDTGCLSSNPSGTYTAEQCAQYGIQTLLSELAPCASNLASCGSATPVDQVGLMTFPGLCSDAATGVTTSNCPAATTLTNTTANPTYAPDDYNCKGTNPPIAAYNNDPEYLILGFQNNYRTSDTASLSQSSDLVDSVDAGAGGCGIQTPGGENTFYAGVIVAAQQYLMANHTSGIQDVMIVLSDGNANATGTKMAGTVKQSVTISGMSGGLWQGTNDCAQAVNAANWAKGYKETDGTYTEIYSVSYNSANVQCSTDTTSITDCQTMQDIGSTPSSQYFFSVPGKKSGTTCTGAVPITYLDQVFTTIAGDLSGSRLIPNSVF